MNKVIKIHGCSGAGKTTAVRELMANFQAKYGQWATPLGANPKKPEAYQFQLDGIEPPVFAIGSYEANCGGVDTITDYHDVINLVEKYHKMGHVIYEGLLQSTYYGSMGTWSQQFGDNFIYAFLDTPAEVCVARVVARREANGTKTKFNPDNTIQKWGTILNLQNKLVDGRLPRHQVRMIHHELEMVPQFREMLK